VELLNGSSATAARNTPCWIVATDDESPGEDAASSSTMATSLIVAVDREIRSERARGRLRHGPFWIQLAAMRTSSPWTPLAMKGGDRRGAAEAVESLKTAARADRERRTRQR